ncbi:MAG: helix-turn-helix domain-containing protein [Candidatus Velthaea sp.]
MRTFGDILRELRVAAGLSQEALAERARVSPGAISTLERSARRAPHRQTLALIGEALHLGAPDRERLEIAAAHARRRAPRGRTSAAFAVPNNLPNAVTSFHGRNREVRSTSELLRSRRLVTIFGPGGVGKTRLALEIARVQRDAAVSSDGVWFVDLAPLTDPALVAATSGSAVAASAAVR